MINFFPKEHIHISKKKVFGLCDSSTSSEKPAFLSENNGKEWIAVVHNYRQESISFVPIDHCVELLKEDGSMDNRCDCCLFHHTTIIFVELKQRGMKGSEWIKQGEKQLRSTISHFEREEQAQLFDLKKAYIANSSKPLFRSGQAVRMQRFFNETGYSLRIENHIKDL